MRNQNGAWRHKYISNKVLCHSDYVRSGGLFIYEGIPSTDRKYQGGNISC